MKKRIIGIDVARALAVIGMIIVNFKIVFGENGNEILKGFAYLFEGKAAATFVVLAGVGIALMSKSALNANGFSLTYALFFSLLCIFFAIIWKKKKTVGPLEWVMRKATK